MNDNQPLRSLASAAILALHATSTEQHFRARDVRFFIELLANWVEYGTTFEQFRVHNTQVARELTRFSRLGVLKSKTVGGVPSYRLTAVGIVELLRNVCALVDAEAPQHLLFRYYFLSSYGPVLRKLLEKDKTSVPLGIRLEIDPLLDVQRLLNDALAQAKRNKQRLEVRIRDSFAMAEATRTLTKKKIPFAEIITAIEKQYPYELNSMKPLSELCAGLPEEMVRWELTEGAERRAEQMWKPALAMLTASIGQIEKLLRECE